MTDTTASTSVVRHADDDRRFAALWRDAQTLAKSKLVPKALQDKPHDVLLVLATGDDLDVPRTQALAQLHPIEGRVIPGAQMQSALAHRAGHELRIEETSSERCTVAVRRRRSDFWQRVTWTIADARRAGLLDVWAERWVSPQGGGSKRPERYVVGDDLGLDEQLVARAPEWARTLIDAGKLQRRDNWAKYPDDMLAARAVTRAVKRFCPDALFGLGRDIDLEDVIDEHPATVTVLEAEEEPEHEERDENIVDAELVDDDAAAAADPDGTPAGDETADLAPATFRANFAMRVQRLDLGRDADDEDRHAVVHHATGGRTRSTRDVLAEEVSSCWATLRQVEDGALTIADVDGVRTVLPDAS